MCMTIIMYYILIYGGLLMIGGLFNRLNRRNLYDDGTVPSYVSLAIGVILLDNTWIADELDCGSDGNLIGWVFGLVICGAINIVVSNLCTVGTWYCGREIENEKNNQ